MVNLDLLENQLLELWADESWPGSNEVEALRAQTTKVTTDQ